MLHRMQHPDYGISGHSSERIRQQLEYMHKLGFRALSLKQLAQHLRNGQPVPYKSVVFTIDDGFIDHHDIAGPLFAEYDIPLTYFLITDFIDQKLWPWDDQLAYAIEHAAPGQYTVRLHDEDVVLDLGDDARKHNSLKQFRDRMKRLDNTDIYQQIRNIADSLNTELPQQAPREHSPMSWQQANDLVNRGHDVAAHTCSHRILSMLQDETAANEISASISRVRQQVQGAANVFAYPTGRTGDFTAREITSLQQQGVLATVSTVSAPCRLDADYTLNSGDACHDLPRFAMPDSLTDFIQYLGWIEYIKTRLRQH